MNRPYKDRMLAYEKQFGMSSEEFARRWYNGELDESFEFNHWADLIERNEKMWAEIDTFFNAPDPIPPEIVGAATHIPCGTFTIDNNRVYEIGGMNYYEVVDKHSLGDDEPPEDQSLTRIARDEPPNEAALLNLQRAYEQIASAIQDANEIERARAEAAYHQSMIADD